MTKEFFIIVAVIVLGLFGLFTLTKDKDESSNGASTTAEPSNHTVGAGDKKVTLIEYGDFQCPACKSYFPIVNEIKSSYGDDITFQFRHYPLNQIHPNAFIGSRAAEAAGKQGKFFEMHDLLYEQQEVWSSGTNPTATLESYATQLGLDLEKFKADMTSAETAAVINADVKAGQAIGANSTPTFVINGRKIDENPRSVEDFKKLIDEEIAKANNE